jgi:hypothetical protein
MNAVGTLLKGLIDYAGLYPPAGLAMSAAVQSYLAYSSDEHRAALGRFVVDLNRLSEVREFAGESFRGIRLSVIAQTTCEWERLHVLLDDGFRIEMAEVKVGCAAEVEYVCQRVPSGIEVYFEIPMFAGAEESIAAIEACDARAKLRMGGLVASAFPAARDIAVSLKSLADRAVAFKATAGCIILYDLVTDSAMLLTANRE